MTLALDDFGTTALNTVYTVFVADPATGSQLDALRSDNLYTASALANHLHDAGYQVCTDMWDSMGRYAAIDDAMVSPAVWKGYRLDQYPPVGVAAAVPLVCTLCGGPAPTDIDGTPGVNIGARCWYTACDGRYARTTH